MLLHLPQAACTGMNQQSPRGEPLSLLVVQSVSVATPSSLWDLTSCRFATTACVSCRQWAPCLTQWLSDGHLSLRSSRCLTTQRTLGLQPAEHPQTITALQRNSVEAQLTRVCARSGMNGSVPCACHISGVTAAPTGSHSRVKHLHAAVFPPVQRVLDAVVDLMIAMPGGVQGWVKHHLLCVGRRQTRAQHPSFVSYRCLRTLGCCQDLFSREH